MMSSTYLFCLRDAPQTRWPTVYLIRSIVRRIIITRFIAYPSDTIKRLWLFTHYWGFCPWITFCRGIIIRCETVTCYLYRISATSVCGLGRLKTSISWSSDISLVLDLKTGIYSSVTLEATLYASRGQGHLSKEWPEPGRGCDLLGQLTPCQEHSFLPVEIHYKFIAEQ